MRAVQSGSSVQSGWSYAPTTGTLTGIDGVLVNTGFRLTKFTEEPVNLETAFMRLTKGLVQQPYR